VFKKVLLLSALILSGLVGTVALAKEMSWSSAPEMKIDKSKAYSAVIDTSKGKFTIELFAKEAPNTVNNFVFLAQKGFYNNVVFHRIIQQFMIQTGDPKGNGTGDPGYKFADELGGSHKYGPGIVAMANSGPNTNGSQFFVCTGLQSANLNSMPNYTIFGNVTSGMDVVSKIAATPVESNGLGENSKPKEKVVIKSVKILTK
jgi:cyclophilin family peptidyl-prolyl cis-trans isomerase